MIQKTFLSFFFLMGMFFVYAQPENNVRLLIECYEEYYQLNKTGSSRQPQGQAAANPVCIPEPEGFYDFFETKFIDFKSLREGEKVKTFSFSDSLCSPLKRDLIITSVYGMRGNKKHYGVDFRVNIGDTVRSVFCGKVRVAKYDPQYGLVVVIRNYNMSETVYAHLDKVFVKVNQQIRVGQPIGTGGNTGKSSAPHLHFELRYNGFPINPIVKEKFLMKIETTKK